MQYVFAGQNYNIEVLKGFDLYNYGTGKTLRGFGYNPATKTFVVMAGIWPGYLFVNGTDITLVDPQNVQSAAKEPSITAISMAQVTVDAAITQIVVNRMVVHQDVPIKKLLKALLDMEQVLKQ